MQFSLQQRKNLLSEVLYSAVRSSGPGGQNVNKLNTKVEIRFSVINSNILSVTEKNKIRVKLKNRINAEGELVLVSQIERSQWRNREKVTEKFFFLLEDALTPVKKRIKTKPSYSSRLKRIESKKKLGQKKQLRKPPEF